MTELTLEIVTPAKTAFSGEIKSITVPGTKGRFQVLRNHAPIISTLDIGMIKVDLPDGKENYYSSAGGTVEVLDNKVIVFADSIELISEIDEERALQAKQRAEERLAEKNSELNVVRAQAALSRSINRLNVKEKYNH